jgi:hypothetical protein
MRLDYQILGLNSDFQTYSLLLSKAAVGSGSKTNFTANFSKISAFRTQWQIESSANESMWGFDADNSLIVDNIKVERIYTGLPPVVISANGNNISVGWTAPSTGTVKLQSATSLNGTFTDVSNAPNPYTVTPPAGSTRFFRTVWVP